MNLFFKADHCEAPEIPAFEPVLQGWIDTQRDYVAVCPADNPWDYRERSCIGFLAAGAWRAGGVAIEEWVTEKGPEGERSPGRGDLWIRCRDQNDFCIEAKRMWPNPNVAGNLHKQLADIESKLSNATNDVSTHGRPSPEEQVGILFVTPSCLPDTQERMNEQIAAWLESIYSIHHSAIAWTFPGRLGLPSTPHSIVPGIVLIARTNK